jgi:hypothetical protein
MSTTTVSPQQMDGEAHETLAPPLTARCRRLCDESDAICQRSAHLRQESATLLARCAHLRSETTALLQYIHDCALLRGRPPRPRAVAR